MSESAARGSVYSASSARRAFFSISSAKEATSPARRREGPQRPRGCFGASLCEEPCLGFRVRGSWSSYLTPSARHRGLETIYYYNICALRFEGTATALIGVTSGLYYQHGRRSRCARACHIVQVLAVAARDQLAVEADSALVERHKGCQEAGGAQRPQRGVTRRRQRRPGRALQVEHHERHLQRQSAGQADQRAPGFEA